MRRVLAVPGAGSTTLLEGGQKKTLPVIDVDSVRASGGDQILFEEVYQALQSALPAQSNLEVSKDPLIMITPLKMLEGRVVTAYKDSKPF